MSTIVESYIAIDRARENSYLLGTWYGINKKEKLIKTYYEIIKGIR